MFYWRIGDREVVLTDYEETALLDRAGFSAAEKISFRIAVPEGKLLQERLGRFLEEYARREPQQFELEFVNRSGVGPEHLPELHALIDSYTRTCGRLSWGAPAYNEWHEQFGTALWLGSRPDVLSLTIQHPVRRWFRREWDVVGQITFPAAEIERFYGTGYSLFIATSRLMIRAAEDYVQVLQPPDDESNIPTQSEA